MRTIDPLRTAASLPDAFRGRSGQPRTSGGASNVRYKAPQNGHEKTPPPSKEDWNGSWSEHLLDRRRSDPDVGGQRERLGSRADDDRRHPDGRRSARARALDDLLVVVGRLP